MTLLKNILILNFLMLTVNCSAQLIIPIEDFENYNKEIPNYSYIMDTNNLLTKYTGTWIGTYNGFKYTLFIVKITEDNTHLKYKHDKLIVNYKVVDTSNNELVNTFNFDSSSPYMIRGKYLRSDGGGYVLNYFGLEGKCGQNGLIFINTEQSNLNKLKFGYYVKGEIYEDCQKTNVAQIFPPNSNIEFTKQ